MTVTALVLAGRGEYTRKHPGCVTLPIYGPPFTSAEDYYLARCRAIRQVQTEHFFFLDDDDDLPADVADVLAECLAKDKALVYTDELVRDEAGKERLVFSGPYTQAEHYDNPLKVHNLALCRTADALAVVDSLPSRGHYWPKMMIYWELAKRGVAYVPRVGYIWNVRGGDMHTLPYSIMSQTRSVLWCKENR